MTGQDGFEAFFAAGYDRLVRTLWSYCGDRSLAEEAAQEAFVRASRDWRRVSRMQSPAGWLHRVAYNEVNRHFRRVRSRTRAITRLGTETVDRAVDVDGAMELHDAMQRLPDRQRIALALHYLADLPIAQIAQVMDAREGTVKSLLSRGREALRTRLVDTETLGKERDDVH